MKSSYDRKRGIRILCDKPRKVAFYPAIWCVTNGTSGDCAVIPIIDLEQVHANGNYCHCGDAFMKEGKPPSPPQKTTSKQRQRI